MSIGIQWFLYLLLHHFDVKNSRICSSKRRTGLRVVCTLSGIAVLIRLRSLLGDAIVHYEAPALEIAPLLSFFLSSFAVLTIVAIEWSRSNVSPISQFLPLSSPLHGVDEGMKFELVFGQYILLNVVCMCVCVFIHMKDEVEHEDERDASALSHITFTWLSRLLSIGAKRQLQVEDLRPIRPDDRAKVIGMCTTHTHTHSLNHMSLYMVYRG